MNRFRPGCDWLALWILWSAWCSISGWSLSSLAQLDRAGYVVMVLLFMGGIILTRRSWLAVARNRPLFLLRRSTYRRLAPKLWLVLVVVSLVGGLCYHADNYDYLTYRFPRLIHWWWARHWFWIETTTPRMNFSATGFEWLMAPIFVLFQSDRPFFLINLTSYVMLPGLIFSVFRDFGVKSRTAWWWMWVLPAGLCYALQAGGVGNDMFSCVYLLGAFYYGGKARDGSTQGLVLSILSIALLSNCKASNIPLAAPWLGFIYFHRRIFLRNPRVWVAVLITLPIAFFSSVLPTLVCNYHFTGDYAGDPTNWENMKVANPWLGFLGNTLMILAANLSPPLLPHDLHWHFLAQGLQQQLSQAYPRFSAYSPGLVLEESCCLGIGASFLLILATLYGLRTPASPRKFTPPAHTKWIAVGLVLAWLVVMAKLASEEIPRIVAPYYLLTLGVTLALLPFDSSATRRPLWRALSYFTLLSAIVIVFMTPGLPLFPIKWVAVAKVNRVSQDIMENWRKNRDLRVSRFDMFHSFRVAIPPSEKTVGLVCGDDVPGVSLWLPFGSREVIELDPVHDFPGDERFHSIHYIVVSDNFIRKEKHLSIGELCRKWSATLVRAEGIPLKTSQIEPWSLLRLH